MPIAQSRISTVSITEPRIHALVESILRQQNTAVLGTCFMEIPRCSQVPFAVSEDLRTIVIITAQNTAKYENMAANPNVSLLVAAPAAEEATLQALTVTAFAAKPKGERKSQAMALFIRKHPALRTTASSPDTALVELKGGQLWPHCRFSGKNMRQPGMRTSGMKAASRIIPNPAGLARHPGI